MIDTIWSPYDFGQWLICPTCEGHGYIWWWDNDEGDWVSVECKDCEGKGVIEQ